MQLRFPEFLFLKWYEVTESGLLHEKLYVFSFSEAARLKPQIFKVVRQEWSFEVLSSRGLVSGF